MSGFTIGESPIEGPAAPAVQPLSDLLMDAFERCGLRGNALVSEQIASGRRSLGLVQGIWANRGINLWKVIIQPISLTPGIESYPIDPSTIEVLNVFLRYTAGAEQLDRVLYPETRGRYGAIPNKKTPGPPAAYLYERTLLPTIKVWPSPDNGGPYQLLVHTQMRMNDAIASGGSVGDMPFRFYPAFVNMLAADIAIKWAPERATGLAGLAQTLWLEVASSDTEHAPFRIEPDLSVYFQS